MLRSSPPILLWSGRRRCAGRVVRALDVAVVAVQEIGPQRPGARRPAAARQARATPTAAGLGIARRGRAKWRRLALAQRDACVAPLDADGPFSPGRRDHDAHWPTPCRRPASWRYGAGRWTVSLRIARGGAVSRALWSVTQPRRAGQRTGPSGELGTPPGSRRALWSRPLPTWGPTRAPAMLRIDKICRRLRSAGIRVTRAGQRTIGGRRGSRGVPARAGRLLCRLPAPREPVRTRHLRLSILARSCSW